jgi:hypothetical protein
MVTYSYDPTYPIDDREDGKRHKSWQNSQMALYERSKKAYFREIPFHQSDLITDGGWNPREPTLSHS